MDVAIIGGGAAGFFLAANLKQLAPQVRVVIFEKQSGVMKKVLMSGGGRCNLTNTFDGVTDLRQVYPRGHRLLKKLFKEFGPEDAYRWFEQRGVPLVCQDDGCVFPAAQDARAVTGCLQRITARQGVEVRTGHRVENIIQRDGKYELVFTSPHRPCIFNAVVVTTGGSPRSAGLDYLARLGHKIEQPVPSLFAFNIPDAQLCAQTGTVVGQASVSIPGTPYKQSGALLITHWGMSGPAILKLSSHAARHIHEACYKFPLLVNWTGEAKQEEVALLLQSFVQRYPQKQMQSQRAFGISSRLWEHLLRKAGIPVEKKWGEVGKKNIHKLTDTLCNDRYEVEGRSMFREEFVTCGGVSLDSVSARTMESKPCPGLYFAGEVLDIDGVTGGFNFQAAWTTAFTAAQAIANKMRDDS